MGKVIDGEFVYIGVLVNVIDICEDKVGDYLE